MRVVTVPGVFRPRSDSLLLAREAEAVVSPGMRVLDLFTGSGVVAVAAARGGANVTAVDISRRAVGCAWLNARLNGTRLRARRGDMFGPVGDERFDLVTANPPYVPSVSAGQVRGAARAWEGGADGRRFIDRLCDEVGAHLNPGGRLLLVHSSICDVDATIDRLRAAGLETSVVERHQGRFGPLLAARAQALEERGLIESGREEEEVLVFSASAAGKGET